LFEKQVLISGIQSKPELNGSEGIVVNFDPESGRYVVKLDGLESPMKLKPENLSEIKPIIDSGIEEESESSNKVAKGKDTKASVELDMSKFLATMQSVLGEGAGDANVEPSKSWIEDDDEDGLDDDEGDTSDDEEAADAGEGLIDGDEDEAGVQDIAEAMDEELAGEGGMKGGKKFDPVELDMDVVSNLLKSYEAQDGNAGPVSNMLRSMGINLPDNLDGMEGPEEEDTPGESEAAGGLMDLD